MERPESLTQERLETLLSNAVEELQNHLCDEDKARLADYLRMTEEELAYFGIKEEKQMKQVFGKKGFSFGKVAYRNPNVRNNEVTVDIEWKPNNSGRMVFSACGDIWNSTHTDIYCGGQCLDKLNEFPTVANNPIFKEIYRLWKLYHLNDMHAGTVEQEEALRKHFGTVQYGVHYEEKCAYLKSIGLYEVPHPETGEPFQYGHGWLYREIPEEDVKIIKSLFGGEA